jgi:hypothetical protein
MKNEGKKFYMNPLSPSTVKEGLGGQVNFEKIEPTKEQIEKAAYSDWEKSGKTHGHDVPDYFNAQNNLRKELNKSDWEKVDEEWTRRWNLAFSKTEKVAPKANEIKPEIKAEKPARQTFDKSDNAPQSDIPSPEEQMRRYQEGMKNSRNGKNGNGSEINKNNAPKESKNPSWEEIVEEMEASGQFGKYSNADKKESKANKGNVFKAKPYPFNNVVKQPVVAEPNQKVIIVERIIEKVVEKEQPVAKNGAYWAKKWASGEMSIPWGSTGVAFDDRQAQENRNEVIRQRSAAERFGIPVGEAKNHPRKPLEEWEKDMIRKGQLKIDYPIDELIDEQPKQKKVIPVKKDELPEDVIPAENKNKQPKKDDGKAKPEKPEDEKQDEKPNESDELNPPNPDDILDAFWEGQNRGAKKGYKFGMEEGIEVGLGAGAEIGCHYGKIEGEDQVLKLIEEKRRSKNIFKKLKILFKHHPKNPETTEQKADKLLRDFYRTYPLFFIAGAATTFAAWSAMQAAGVYLPWNVPIKEVNNFVNGVKVPNK